jgi:hypothetical protein
MIATYLLLLFLQAPAVAGPTVVVGLKDGTNVTIGNPEFSGFIDGRGVDAVLSYHEGDLHGEMPLTTISRIEFGPYKKGHPFLMKVTLCNGDQRTLESEHHNFVTIKGRTDFGNVTIKHPDPVAVPLKITTKKPNRKRDLTIQYLEFPPS